MINFERMRSLHAVAKHGSVAAAAGALHVTNSAISQQIAKLETEVGVPLLEKNGRGVRITDAAGFLVVRAEQVLSVMERTEAEFDARREAVVGQMTVGAFATAIRGLAPYAMPALRKAHPQLRVTLKEMEPQPAMTSLVRGDIDLVIATDWMNAPLRLAQGLSKKALMDDVADIAIPARHKLASRKSLRLEDLALERWIAWNDHSICYDWLMHTLRSSGHDPEVSHMASEHATQLALVAAGCGICVIPRLGRGSVPPRVKIVEVKPALRRHVYTLWREGSTRRRAIGAAIDAFRRAGACAHRHRVSGQP